MMKRTTGEGYVDGTHKPEEVLLLREQLGWKDLLLRRGGSREEELGCL